MKIAHCKIKGVSQIQFSRYHCTPKLNEKEKPQEYEERTWMNRFHKDQNGEVFIPANMLKNALAAMAKYLSINIPGQKNAKYTKNFLAGVMVFENSTLTNNGKPLTESDMIRVDVLASSSGKPNGPTKVPKHFPTFPEWEAEMSFYIFDDIIPKDVFERVLDECGKFNGLGTWRPQNGGTNGRFTVESVEWDEE